MYHEKGRYYVYDSRKAVRDLKKYYPVVSLLKPRPRDYVTNNGKSEAVLIPYEEFEKYEEILHIKYVKEN